MQQITTDFDDDVLFDAMPLDSETFPSCFWCWLPLITDQEVGAGCHAACIDEIEYECNRCTTQH